MLNGEEVLIKELGGGKRHASGLRGHLLDRRSNMTPPTPAHLHGLHVEDVLSEDGQEVLAHAVAQVVQRSAARGHAAAHALQGAPQLFLRRRPAGVHGAVLAELRQVLWRGSRGEWRGEKEEEEVVRQANGK